jgi:hypothetical protein
MREGMQTICHQTIGRKISWITLTRTLQNHKCVKDSEGYVPAKSERSLTGAGVTATLWELTDMVRVLEDWEAAQA